MSLACPPRSSFVLALPVALGALACQPGPVAAPVAPGPWTPPSQAASTRPRADDPVSKRTLVWRVDVARARYVPAFLATDLAAFLPGTKVLPGVARTEALTPLPYPAVGSVRRVVLNDGTTAEEEVLEQDAFHLRYLVARYTSPKAEAVAYGIGEFRFDDEDAATATRITWTYAFKLDPDRFPGSWGAPGRALFRGIFLNTDYADFMATGRDAMRAWAATLGPPAPK